MEMLFTFLGLLNFGDVNEFVMLIVKFKSGIYIINQILTQEFAGVFYNQCIQVILAVAEIMYYPFLQNLTPSLLQNYCIRLFT